MRGRAMHLLSGLLPGRVLERVLIVSLLAAILPVGIAGFLSHEEVSSRLERQAESQLRETAKSYGYGVLERMKSIATDAARAIAAAVPVTQALGDRVLGVELVDRSELEEWIERQGYDGYRLGLSPRAGRDRPVLLVRPRDCCRSDILIAITGTSATAGEPDFVLLELNPGYVWGPPENLPYLTDLCAFDHRGNPLFCNREIADGLDLGADFYDGPQGRTSVRWMTADGDEHLASTWELFLAGNFVTPPWTFVVSQPVEYMTRAADSYQDIFVPVLAVVALLVIVLASRLLRRSLAPLHQLTEATRSLASGNLQSRVRVSSRDEFRQLAAAFNTMASRLGDQLATLQGLSHLDRLMLHGADADELCVAVAGQMAELVEIDYIGVLLVECFADDKARLLLRGAEAPVQLSHCRFDGSAWTEFDGLLELAGEDSPLWAELPEAFRASGCTHVFVLPIISEKAVSGLLLLGHQSAFEMPRRTSIRLSQLVDRLALAQSAARRDEALYRQAHFDELTGLPNRQLMMDHLQQQLVQAERDAIRGAVLFVDLDRFKQINDAWGHGAGDQLLYEAAQRIRASARISDTVARIGGDEFAIVVSPLDDLSETTALANRLITELSSAFRIGGSEHFVSASIGITVFPDDGNSVEQILRNADTAMYRAKDAGRARLQLFDESMNRETVRRVELERELRLAIESEGLCLHYQPQVDLDGGRMFGVEALVRWPHPERGLVPAGEFITIAEDSGLIVKLGEWVMETAWSQFRSWVDADLDLDCVSVNISRRQFRDPDFVKGILACVDRIGVDPQRIELEITETAVAADIEAVAGMLRRLREVGFRIAIDDFGIGYSSLSQLQRLPFDTLKIDKSFVDHLTHAESGSRAIVHAIIALARHMGKSVIAEGVETAEQAAILQADGCRRMQGYLYGKPVDPARISDMAAEFRSKHARALAAPRFA